MTAISELDKLLRDMETIATNQTLPSRKKLREWIKILRVTITKIRPI
jgi:hypothetical protein